MNQVYVEFYARRRHWSSYQRLQLALGLAVAVLAPFIVTLQWPGRADELILLNSAVAAASATVGGFLACRRFSRFPGISAVGAIIPCFAIGYLCVIAALFFLRIDYSRLQFAAAFVLTLIWFTAMHVVARRNSQYVFAVVPEGMLGAIRSIDLRRYHFHFLNSPQEIKAEWDGVIADFRAPLSAGWERLLVESVMRGIPVYHVKKFVEQLTGRVDIEHLSENTLDALNQQAYLQLRDGAERILAALALVVLSPLLLAVAILIKAESPGPALFSQARVGYRGRRFKVLKFRTMRHDDGGGEGCERSRAMTRPDDDRITRIGRFLRRTRIDELPQIINILRGEMSWIGPRPEAVALSDWYEAELPFYRYRHMVRPGITGWAQVCQGHVTELGAIRSKLQYDFYYIKNLSFWLDMVILFRTFRIVLTGHGAR